MKYKEGDKVRIKSIDWYNENKSKSHGTVACGGKYFEYDMREWCGKTMTILTAYQTCYIMREDGAKDLWTDEMIEGLVEDEMSLDKAGQITDFEYEGLAYTLPEGYIFKDENGNEIHALKIVLEKANTLKIQSDNMETDTHRGYYTTEPETTNKSKKLACFTFWDNDFADKVELDLSNRELIQEVGKWFVVKKKNEYPTTYEECCEIVKVGKEHTLEGEIIRINNYKIALLESFQKLLICRDAYWKIAGEEMRLGKPWEPDWNTSVPKYVIACTSNGIEKQWETTYCKTFAFPTEEMRDAFYENFKGLIEECKELL